jgi:hypothetical protein
VSLRPDQLIPVKMAADKKEQLGLVDEEEEEKTSYQTLVLINARCRLGHIRFLAIRTVAARPLPGD